MSRILLSAYACEPGKGSEPAVGWMWATELGSRGHQVWVLTRKSNRRAIEAAVNWPPRADVHFAYVDLPAWSLPLKKLPGGNYLYYFVWQWLAFCRARKLHREKPFDCVHHVTFVSLRAPSFMGWLGIPFLLGPVSGGERVPWALRRDMSSWARAFELARDCANFFLHFDSVMRSAFRRATRIYVTSRESLALIPRRFHHKCEVQLAIGLTRTQLALCRRKMPSRRSVLHCAYAGRLLEWKGLRTALLAMRNLKSKNVPVHLTIIGDGPAQKSLRSLALELDIADRLDWLPWLPHNELQVQLHDHDVLMFPSLRDSGGMAVLEALAHGLPVICTDLGGPGEIVNNHCGRVVPTGGKTSEAIAADIAAHLESLVRNPGLLQSLSLNARRRAWDFEFGRIVDRVYQTERVEPERLPEAASL
jgi:glycosyltransferase involved in cell wall biosynthesis